MRKRGNAEETSMKMEMAMEKRREEKRENASQAEAAKFLQLVKAGKSNRRTLFLTYVNLHKCPHKSDKWVPFALHRVAFLRHLAC